jgi:biopolymer transport protein ExbB/TolQ
MARLLTFIISIATAVMVMVVAELTLPPYYEKVFFDIKGSPMWPISCQAAMWIVFFMGLGELILRLNSTGLEEAQIRRGYLPTDDLSMLQPNTDALVKIYQSANSSRYKELCFLPRLLLRCILHFNQSHSVSQTATMLNSTLDLYMHEVDLRYNVTRYISWLIPSLGFIGTVIGIMWALDYAGVAENAKSENFLYEVTARLGVAFTTTLVALIMAAILVLLHNLIQAREERVLNRIGQYVLDQFINRLLEPQQVRR